MVQRPAASNEGLSHPFNLPQEEKLTTVLEEHVWKSELNGVQGGLWWTQSAPARSLSKERSASQVWATGVGVL